MDENKRLITSWVRIKHWLSENFPETLENLYSPAFDSQITAAETTIGLHFPDALKTLLLEHNGEDHHWPPGIFPGGHRFLPTEDIVETWYKLKEYNDAAPESWLPFSQSKAKSIRFLDFNPPQGGTPGQVVEVDFNQQTYDVLAESLVAYIEKYAIDLAVNKYAVIGDDILLNNESLNMDNFPQDVAQSRPSGDSFVDSFVDPYLDGETADENVATADDMMDFELLDELADDVASEQELPDIDMANIPVLDAEVRIDRPNQSQAASQRAAYSAVHQKKGHHEDHDSVDYKALDEVLNEILNDARIDVLNDDHNDVYTDAAANNHQKLPHSTVKQNANNTLNQAQHKQQASRRARAQRQEKSSAQNDTAGIHTPARSKTAATAKPAAKPAVQSAAKPAAKPVAQNTAKKPQPVAQQVRKAVENQPAKQIATPPKPASDRLESGERLIIVGEMTTLMGKEEMLFTVETEHAKEYTFLAKASFTKGFGEIGLDQYVRILAKKFHGEIKSHFIDLGLAQQPEYVAFEYVVLPVEKPSANKASLPPPENIDEIAHNILHSIQNSFRRSTDYKEVKPDQSTYLRSKFYNDNTEKLLKLGFHYTADLADQAAAKSGQNIAPFFRVMSFFDDGIVACFYHIKPKFSWPFHASRKVIEFETELSDGNIIISSTAEDEIEYPLPKTINRYMHPANIPIEGLLHKHRAKIRRYQTHKPDAAIVKVRSKKEFVALRQRRQQMIYNHLKSIGWVTKEYVAKQFNNKEVAEQVYARIKQFAGTKV
jgi:cell wall assembly regulator SMI1